MGKGGVCGCKSRSTKRPPPLRGALSSPVSQEARSRHLCEIGNRVPCLRGKPSFESSSSTSSSSPSTTSFFGLTLAPQPCFSQPPSPVDQRSLQYVRLSAWNYTHRERDRKGRAEKEKLDSTRRILASDLHPHRIPMQSELHQTLYCYYYHDYH